MGWWTLAPNFHRRPQEFASVPLPRVVTPTSPIEELGNQSSYGDVTDFIEFKPFANKLFYQRYSSERGPRILVMKRIQ